MKRTCLTAWYIAKANFADQYQNKIAEGEGFCCWNKSNLPRKVESAQSMIHTIVLTIRSRVDRCNFIIAASAKRNCLVWSLVL